MRKRVALSAIFGCTVLLAAGCAGGASIPGTTAANIQRPLAFASTHEAFSNWHIYAAGGSGSRNNTLLEEFNETGDLLHPTGDFAHADGPQQSGMAYDPRNGYIYVANSLSKTITAYDKNGVQQLLTGNFAGSATPYAIAFDTKNHLLYVMNSGEPSIGMNAAVTAYDEQGNQVVLSGGFPGLSASGRAIAFDEHNGWIYCLTSPYASVASSITAYDARGHQMTLSGGFANLQFAQGLMYDPHDGFIYVPAVSMYAFDEAGNPKTLVPGFPSSLVGGMAYDPHNNIFYASLVAGTGEVTIAPFDEEGNPQSILTGHFDAPRSHLFSLIVVP